MDMEFYYAFRLRVVKFTDLDINIVRLFKFLYACSKWNLIVAELS